MKGLYNFFEGGQDKVNTLKITNTGTPAQRFLSISIAFMICSTQIKHFRTSNYKSNKTNT